MTPKSFRDAPVPGGRVEAGPKLGGEAGSDDRSHAADLRHCGCMPESWRHVVQPLTCLCLLPAVCILSS